MLSACGDEQLAAGATDEVASEGPPVVADAFPMAAVVPETVRVGDTVVVTPAFAVQPTCFDFAPVFEVVAGESELIGYATAGEGWQDVRTGPTPTFPPCQPPITDAPATYTIPSALTPGTYSICRTDDIAPGACATFTVQP